MIFSCFCATWVVVVLGDTFCCDVLLCFDVLSWFSYVWIVGFAVLILLYFDSCLCFDVELVWVGVLL